MSPTPADDHRLQAEKVVPQYSPMQATQVKHPFHRDGWVHEEKVDGYRMLAYKNCGRVRLVSRNGVDHTRRYPDVAAAIGRLTPAPGVLDGELAVFDRQLRSRFDWLRPRQPADIATPPVLIAFDLLYIKSRELTSRPLRDRRRRLEDLIADADSDLVHVARRLAPQGLDA